MQEALEKCKIWNKKWGFYDPDWEMNLSHGRVNVKWDSLSDFLFRNKQLINCFCCFSAQKRKFSALTHPFLALLFLTFSPLLLLDTCKLRFYMQTLYILINSARVLDTFLCIWSILRFICTFWNANFGPLLIIFFFFLSHFRTYLVWFSYIYLALYFGPFLDPFCLISIILTLLDL